MSQRPGYFKLGLFVIVSVGLILVSVSLLGADALFRTTVPAETYFPESVEGLTVGSPVKLRGVTMGKVSWIGFVEHKYRVLETAPDEAPKGAWVMVEMAFDASRRPAGVVRDHLALMIREGLRIRMARAGLTGGNYLELFFPGDGAAPPLKFPWTPDSLYIPSAPSVLGQIESAAERIARQLESADIGGILADIRSLVRNLDTKVEEFDVPRLQTDVLALIDGLRESNAKLQAILSSPRIDQILGDVASVTAALRGAIGEQEGDLAEFVRDLPALTGRLKAAAGELERILTDEQTTRMLANLSKASDALPGATEDIRALARRLELLFAAQQQNIAAILVALRQTIENAEALTEDAKRNPSRLLFGEPPPRITPGSGPPGR